MQAIGEKIILEPVDLREVRVGSLVLPNVAVADNTIWRVVNIGPDVKHIRPGDFVICPVHVLQQVHVAGKEYAVVREDHVYAVLSEEEVYGGYPTG